MTQQYNVTTTGTAPTVVLQSLDVTLTHPETVDLMASFRLWEINSCKTLQQACEDGTVIVTDMVTEDLLEVNSLGALSWIATHRAILTKAVPSIIVSLASTVTANFTATSLAQIYSVTILDSTGVEIQDQLDVAISGNTLAVTSNIAITNIQILMIGV